MGFVAGTLVHTPDGLRPIETLRPGDLVLSPAGPDAPESIAPITRVACTEEEIVLVHYFMHGDVEPRSLVAGRLQLWSQSDVDWLEHDRFEPGQDMEARDGQQACVYCIHRILATEIPDVGWAEQPNSDHGIAVDLRGGRVNVVRDASAAFPWEELSAEAGQAPESDAYAGSMRRQVYCIEVAAAGGYCVGEAGIWARDVSPFTP